MKVFPALHPGCFARFGDRAGAEPGNGDELIFGDPFVWRYRRSQLIALPVPGGAGPVQYRYAVRVSGHCVPVSYQLVQQMVGEFNRQAEAFACRNSTDDMPVLITARFRRGSDHEKREAETRGF